MKAAMMASILIIAGLSLALLPKAQAHYDNGYYNDHRFGGSYYVDFADYYEHYGGYTYHVLPDGTRHLVNSPLYTRPANPSGTYGYNYPTSPVYSTTPYYPPAPVPRYDGNTMFNYDHAYPGQPLYLIVYNNDQSFGPNMYYGFPPHLTPLPGAHPYLYYYNYDP